LPLPGKEFYFLGGFKMIYQNGAKTVFQIRYRGSVYSVEDGIFRNDGIGTDFETFDEAYKVLKMLPQWEQASAEIEEF
jgi:hypothetical protein